MIRRSTNELSIRPKMSPRTKLLITIGVTLLSIAAIYGAFLYGVYSSADRADADKIKLEVLQERVKKLDEELESTQNDLIFAQRQQQIQEEAYRQISAAYANSEEKNRVLGSTVDFYRSIISPADNQEGPAIQAIEPRLGEGKLDFDVTLVQAIRHKSQIRGQLRVQAYVNDELVGQWPSASGRSVSYQYFTKVSGTIEDARLTSDSNSNLRVLVTLDLAGDEPLSRWFDYTDLSP